MEISVSGLLLSLVFGALGAIVVVLVTACLSFFWAMLGNFLRRIWSIFKKWCK